MIPKKHSPKLLNEEVAGEKASRVGQPGRKRREDFAPALGSGRERRQAFVRLPKGREGMKDLAPAAAPVPARGGSLQRAGSTSRRASRALKTGPKLPAARDCRIGVRPRRALQTSPRSARRHDRRHWETRRATRVFAGRERIGEAARGQFEANENKRKSVPFSRRKRREETTSGLEKEEKRRIWQSDPSWKREKRRETES